MLIAHKFPKNFLEQEIYQGQAQGNVGFLLTNQSGDYVSFFNENQNPAQGSAFLLGYSRYEGWFFRKEGNLFKIIENIELADKEETQELQNEFWRVVRKTKTKNGIFAESFFMPHHKRALVYELNRAAAINLFLDFKASYDNQEEQRFYNLEMKKKQITIECQNKKEKVFLVLHHNGSVVSAPWQWVKKDYVLDKKRNSLPFERFVFWALNLKCSKLVGAVANEKKYAQQQAAEVFAKTYKFKKEKRRLLRKELRFALLPDKEKTMAFLCAQNALSALLFEENKETHLAAGLPWFFQVYSRDEMIALKALFQNKKSFFAKLIFQMLPFINEQGRLPNKLNDKTVDNADGVGWLFQRIGEYLQKNKLNEIVLWKIKKYLQLILEKSFLANQNEQLSCALGHDTWMDTLNRQGYRLELQALRLYMLQLAYQLTKDPVFKIQEANLKFKVKEYFWTGKLLLDAPDDFLIRPNIFLAAYIYPELLEKPEWEICFDNALSALWLDWGAIATCDKNASCFHSEHTGENPASYHQGDSWFYLNNLAALVLHRINSVKYKDYIEKILHNSAQEILLMGIIGCHSELSSACALRAEGCWNQAWSNALFLELIRELYSL